MNALVQSRGKADGYSPLTTTQATTDHMQYLTFMLGGEIFAIGILAIKEIIEYSGVTEVPMMPECIRGVINLRGAVVPVMDLSTRFGKQAGALTKRTCVVIVETVTNDEKQVIGVIVDAVNAVVEIAPSEIAPPPTFGARIQSDFIEGMGKLNERFIIILNLNRVLSSDEVAALNAADTTLQALGSTMP